MTYETDKTIGHREYWQSLLAGIREESKDPDSMTLEELDRLTRKEVQ